MFKGIKAGAFSLETFTIVMFTAALAVSGCGKGSAAKMVAAGDTVSVKYKLTLDDGSHVDSSMDAKPLQFVAGEGQMIKGFDAAVIGMTVNEEKSFVVAPTEAYGMHDSTMVRNFPRHALPQDMNPEVGMVLHGSRGEPVKIIGVSADSVLLDLNHPLAGQSLNFAIKLVTLAKGAVPAAPAAPAEVPKAN